MLLRIQESTEPKEENFRHIVDVEIIYLPLKHYFN